MPRWEHPDGSGRPLIKQPPLCLIKATLGGQVTTLHHYFGPSPQDIRCHDDVEQAEPEVPVSRRSQTKWVEGHRGDKLTDKSEPRDGEANSSWHRKT